MATEEGEPTMATANKKLKSVLNCVKCGDKIPDKRRSDAKYCTQSCRAAAEKARYKATHPEYVQRQLKLVQKLRHISEYGHTNFIDNPLLNKKDKFRVARSFGFRSMLEYNIAKQLTEAAVPFKYEGMTIEYCKAGVVFDIEDTGNETWT